MLLAAFKSTINSTVFGSHKDIALFKRPRKYENVRVISNSCSYFWKFRVTNPRFFFSWLSHFSLFLFALCFFFLKVKLKLTFHPSNSASLSQPLSQVSKNATSLWREIITLWAENSVTKGIWRQLQKPEGDKFFVCFVVWARLLRSSHLELFYSLRNKKYSNFISL